MSCSQQEQEKLRSRDLESHSSSSIFIYHSIFCWDCCNLIGSASSLEKRERFCLEMSRQRTRRGQSKHRLINAKKCRNVPTSTGTTREYCKHHLINAKKFGNVPTSTSTYNQGILRHILQHNLHLMLS
mmetsp:Transcript_25152/g.54908  ORF Transcript_25152/g.54908 Transcript_25152/m.54908 type:complete len:128 (+) Transcript_25152:762-1145(+)